MFGRGVCQRIKMDFGNQQQMKRSGGVDVFETNHFAVFIDGLRRNLFGGDFAENTVVHNGSVAV